MRPLSGAATECRSLLRNEFKSVSRSKFSHIKKIQNNVVVSMRPLSGAATECRPVSESRFPLQIFTHRIFNLNDEICSREPSVAREPLVKSRALIKGNSMRIACFNEISFIICKFILKNK